MEENANLQVRQAVASAFPKEDPATILELLDLYGIEPHERERERVQLAIIKLSKGNTDELLSHIATAKRDYRDILMWESQPPPSPQAAAKAIDTIAGMLEKSGKPDEAERLRQLSSKTIGDEPDQ
jgi:hypothetical protein